MHALAVALSQAPLDPVPDAGATLRAVGGMLLVLGLLCVLAWLARRGMLRFPGAHRRSPVSIEAAVPLGDRRSLVVVTVEGRRLLLGLTSAQVSLVTELAPAAPVDFATEQKVRMPEGGGA